MAADALLLNQAIEALRAYSLVRRDPQEKRLSIHRLVQAVLQDTQKQEEQRLWAERAILAVDAALPDGGKYATWPQCERLLSQALAVTERIEQYQISMWKASRLLSETASYLQGRARYGEAEPLLQRALHLWEQERGPLNHLLVAESLTKLATVYSLQGKYAEAESVRTVHAKPWQHGGCVARRTILITTFLMLGVIPNLRNGPQTAVPSL